MRGSLPSLLLLLTLLPAIPAAELSPESKPLSSLAFGSCSRTDLEQPLWPHVAATQAPVFCWLGDCVYNDVPKRPIDEFILVYRQQLAQPDYADFRRHRQIIGTWDDHDYGRNNAGADFPHKAASQQAFLDFLEVPADHPRRQQEGVYASHDFGPPGQRVRVILLDCRFHRQSPGPDSDMLGEAQWRWLDQQLSLNDATWTIIGSGIQVVAEEHRYEKWAEFPASRARLLQLLAQHRRQGVLILSGDRHFAELSCLRDSPLGYPLYDLTSSGLSHSYHSLREEANRHRVGEFITSLNYGLLRFDWQKPAVELCIGTQEGLQILARIPRPALQAAAR